MNFLSVFSQLLSSSEKYFGSNDSWTVLAAFVDEEGNILSMATGVKCLSINSLFDSDSHKLPSYHDLIRDSHAEILARRALLHYCLLNSDKIISKVWLFTTQAPCGDASIINDCQKVTSVGLARGKNDWSKVGYLRTKPGRADSPPTHCLSCSDKILKWIHLGVQGKYLHHKIKLCGIVIGGACSKDSVERAFLTREPSADFQIELLSDIKYNKEPGEPAFEARAWHQGMNKAETLVLGRKQGSKKTPLNSPLPLSSRSIFCDSSLHALSQGISETYEESKRLLFLKSLLFRFWPRVIDGSSQSVPSTSPSAPDGEMERKRARTQ